MMMANTTETTTKAPVLAFRSKDQSAQAPLLDIRVRINALTRLPAMPEMARRIIAVAGDPDSSIADLVSIIELDPSLAAQVVAYARSPLYGFQGEVNSIQTAVSRVLGFSTALNLALGVAATKSFSIPRNIPLGLDIYWRNAVYSAALCQVLSNVLPEHIRPPAGMAYLAGLLHNFGHLVMGHLFKPEFLILNKYIASNPDRDLVTLEREVLGADHTEIGGWLLEHWDMPEEIITAVREHHNIDYQGPDSVYPKLIQMASHLLKAHGMDKDVSSDKIPQALLDALEVGDFQVVAITQQLFEDHEDLDFMARQMAS